jgi:hypothetical protein
MTLRPLNAEIVWDNQKANASCSGTEILGYAQLRILNADGANPSLASVCTQLDERVFSGGEPNNSVRSKNLAKRTPYLFFSSSIFGIAMQLRSIFFVR